MLWCKTIGSEYQRHQLGEAGQKVGEPDGRPIVFVVDDDQRRERENLWIILQKTGWKIKGADGAAELLGIKQTTMISRIKKMGLTRRDA